MHTNEHTRDVGMFGFWVYLMSDCVLFATLFATYAVLRGATAGGPAGVELFSLPFVLVETLLLLTSSYVIGLAVLYQKKSLIFFTLLLGLAFLGLEVYEFRHLILEGFGPSRSAFLSAFFALVGTHGLHVAAGCVWMVVLLAQRKLSDKFRYLALFWHFLDVIWIFIFTFVYLFGLI